MNRKELEEAIRKLCAESRLSARDIRHALATVEDEYRVRAFRETIVMPKG